MDVPCAFAAGIFSRPSFSFRPSVIALTSVPLSCNSNPVSANTSVRHRRSFSRSDSYEQLYCFRYQSRDKLEQVWDPFLLNTEYARMGLPNRAWKVDHSNAQFSMCDTYPPLFYVPRSSTTAMLIGSSQFRSHGRLPVLTYLHANGVIENVSRLRIYSRRL